MLDIPPPRPGSDTETGALNDLFEGIAPYHPNISYLDYKNL